MHKKGIIVLLVALMAAGVAWAGPGNGSLETLRGVYALSGTRSCVQTSPVPEGQTGFTDYPALALTLPGNTRSSHLAGVLTLDGKGGGTLTNRTLQVFNNPSSLTAGMRPLNLIDTTCDVSYGMNADGSLWLATTNCSAENVAGVGVGPGLDPHVEVVWDPAPLLLVSTPDHQFLQLSDVEPVVERSLQRGITFDRICGRNYTAVLTSK